MNLEPQFRGVIEEFCEELQNKREKIISFPKTVHKIFCSVFNCIKTFVFYYNCDASYFEQTVNDA